MGNVNVEEIHPLWRIFSDNAHQLTEDGVLRIMREYNIGLAFGTDIIIVYVPAALP